MDKSYRCPKCDTPNFVTELRLSRADDEPLTCWKCEQFVDHRHVPMVEVRDNRNQHLAGKKVVVMANAGIRYTGTFVEMTDEDVKLRGPTGWIILPLDKVTSVKEEGERPAFPRPQSSVDPSFYDVDDEDPE